MLGVSEHTQKTTTWLKTGNVSRLACGALLGSLSVSRNARGPQCQREGSAFSFRGKKFFFFFILPNICIALHSVFYSRYRHSFVKHCGRDGSKYCCRWKLSTGRKCCKTSTLYPLALPFKGTATCDTFARGHRQVSLDFYLVP